MPCVLIALALLTPRLAVALLWFFTHWFEGLFSSLLWPIVGLVVALVIDLSPVRGHRRFTSRRSGDS